MIAPCEPFSLLKSKPINKSEQFSKLLCGRSFKLEQITSPGSFSSKIYIQEEDEYVILLQGEAVLEMRGREINLKSGESLLIPAHTPHRVLHTSDLPLCIWLALHFIP